jgi:hypothetical protein
MFLSFSSCFYLVQRAPSHFPLLEEYILRINMVANESMCLVLIFLKRLV